MRLNQRFDGFRTDRQNIFTYACLDAHPTQ